MNSLDFFTYFYGELYNRSWLHKRILSPVRFLTRKLANRIIPHYLSKPNLRTTGKEVRVIVSLTSFPARIQDVWKVIECMLKQTLKPYRIILWLSKDQFSEVGSIPESLRMRENEVFRIRFVEGDIKSHKKYYYVSKEYPDDYVFLIDDDIYYPSDILEKTWNVHLSYPDAIICNYSRKIKYSQDGFLKPYDNWETVTHPIETNDVFFGSGGGTLFKPAVLYKDLTNEELFSRLTPLADDIWLNAMVRLANLRVITIRGKLILPVYIANNNKLASQNIGQNQNDIQLKNVIEYYSESIGRSPFN